MTTDGGHSRVSISLSGLRQHLFGAATGGVFRGMGVLLAGSGIGRLIGLASMPVLTRIYGPEDFGVLALFTALVAILAPVTTLRYALALPLPRHDGTAMNLLALSIGLLIGFSLIVALVFWLFGAQVLRFFSMEELAPWWWLVTLGVLGTALYELLSYWATRKRAYKIIATTNVWQSAAGVITKIGLGLIALKPGGLLIGQVVAQTGGIGSFTRGFGSALWLNLRHVRGSRIRKVAWRYRGFPIWRVPSQFILAVSLQAPVMFAAANYSTETTGQLSLALTSLTLPLNMIGAAAGKALYAEAARETSAHRIRDMARQTQRRLFILALLPMTILLLGGDYLFMFVFGPSWREAGHYAQILSPLLLLQFSSAPLMQLLNIISRQVFFLMINLWRVLILIFVFTICLVFELDSYGFAIVYMLAMATYFSFVILSIFRVFSRRGERI